jgi:hypothetical protein
LSSTNLDDLYDAREEAAHESMLRAALFFVASARDRGAFPTDREGLEALLGEISKRVPTLPLAYLPPDPRDDDWPDLDRPVLLVTPGDGESLGLNCWYERARNFTATLRRNGRLADEGFGFGISADPETAVQLEDQQQADFNEIGRRLHERGLVGQQGPQFRGDRFLRTLTAEPQQDSPVQMTGVDLYADGLIVNFIVPDPSDWHPTPPIQLYQQAGLEPPIEDFLRRAKEAGGNLIPSVNVEDDLLTEYLWSGSSGSGVDVHRGAHTFIPAVPSQATELRVSTYAGTVVIPIPSSD